VNDDFEKKMKADAFTFFFNNLPLSLTRRRQNSKMQCWWDIEENQCWSGSLNLAQS
jgi:hypothetical protein